MILPLKTKNTFSTNRLLKSTLNVQASSHSLAVSRSPAAGEIRRRGDSRYFKVIEIDQVKIVNCLQIVVSCYGVTNLNGNVKIQEEIQIAEGTDMEERKEKTATDNRDEWYSTFGCLVHNYTHLNELPHETVRRVAAACREKGIDCEGYVNCWADYLLTLSSLVRAEGQEAQKNHPAPDPTKMQG